MKEKHKKGLSRNFPFGKIVIKLSFLTLLIAFSCSPLRNLNKLQSDRQFKKTENLNFAGEKAHTQWWYFDCVFEDGSVLVFLFTPHHWWDDKKEPDKSLFYISYMNTHREVKSISKVFNREELCYDENSLETPYFNLKKSHEKSRRIYTVDFNVEEIKGSATIVSSSKGYSPFPTGSMGKFATRHILKLKGENLAFRYASHVPQGKVDCSLKINNKSLILSGKAYHEQGWFTGTPDQMGKGWNWFHFVSKNVNIFGKPEDFICLEKKGKRLVAGISFKEYALSDKAYADKTETIMLGGKLTFLSKKLSFNIVPTGKPSTPLIYIPSTNSHQAWGTVAQPSFIYLKNRDKQLVEEGVLLLESCKMSKERLNIIE